MSLNRGLKKLSAFIRVYLRLMGIGEESLDVRRTSEGQCWRIGEQPRRVV